MTPPQVIREKRYTKGWQPDQILPRSEHWYWTPPAASILASEVSTVPGQVQQLGVSPSLQYSHLQVAHASIDGDADIMGVASQCEI